MVRKGHKDGHIEILVKYFVYRDDTISGAKSLNYIHIKRVCHGTDDAIRRHHTSGPIQIS